MKRDKRTKIGLFSLKSYMYDSQVQQRKEFHGESMDYIWKQHMYIKRLPFFCSSTETLRASDFEHLLLKLHTHTQTHTSVLLTDGIQYQ